MAAMTAARLGEPETAIAALFIDSPKNLWLPNGHNRQRANLPLYLVSTGQRRITHRYRTNGAWDGFPKAGWKVRWEGLRNWQRATLTRVRRIYFQRPSTKT